MSVTQYNILIPKHLLSNRPKLLSFLLEIENNGGQQKITLDEVVLDDGPDVDELDKFLRE